MKFQADVISLRSLHNVCFYLLQKDITKKFHIRRFTVNEFGQLANYKKKKLLHGYRTKGVK